MMNNYAPLQGVAENLAQHGRYGDSMLVHMNPIELQGIAALSPTGQLTINPVTGQQEAFLPFLAPLLGGALGLGSLGTAALGGALTWATTGSFKKGIMSALTGWGIGKAFEGLGAVADSVDDTGNVITGLGGGAPAPVTTGMSSAELVKASTQPGFDWLGKTSAPFGKATDFTTWGKITPSVDVVADAATTTPWWGRGGATLGGVGGKEALGVGDIGKVLTAGMQPAPMIAGVVGAGNLAQIEQEEAMDRLAREAGIDDEEARRRAREGMEEGFRQSQADYPQYGYSQYGRSGGLVAINPANYARRRNGFNALAGNPVRMQTGGTAALRQARLRGPRTITPEELAAAGRPGFTPEITYFQPRRVGVAPDPVIPRLPYVPDSTTPRQGGNLSYGYDQSLGLGEGDAQFEPIDPYYGLGRGVNYGGSYGSSKGGSSGGLDRLLTRPPSVQAQAETLISEDYPDIINNQAASDAIDSATNYVAGAQQLAPAVAPAAVAPSSSGSLAEILEEVQSPTGAALPPVAPPVVPAAISPSGPPITNRERQEALEVRHDQLPDGSRTKQRLARHIEDLDDAFTASGERASAFPGMQPFSTDVYSDISSLSPEDMAEVGAGLSGRRGGRRGGFRRFEEGGITDIPPELADEQAVMASADMLPAEAPIENEAANQLIEQTMMAVLGELPPEQAEIVIARFIDEFGEEAFQMLREQALQMAVPNAQTQGMIEGQGGGMDDQIPGMIGNQQPVAVSPGEFIVPADVVSGLGDGSSDAGAAKLDSMMDNVRMAKTGGIMQPRRISNTVLPV